MRIFLSFFFFMLTIALMAQQRPFINSLDKTSGAVGETVIITGSGFSANPADLKVFFGTGEATILSAAPGQIKVSVPANATYGPVSVVHLTNFLTGSSSELFNLSFGGGPLVASGFDAPNYTATGHTFSYDLCMCDFNDDGLLDVGVTHQQGQTVSFFQNQSTPAATSFMKLDLLNYAPPFTTLGVDCADLNADGLPDLVVSTSIGDNAIHTYFYENTSGANIAFTQRQSTRLPSIPATPSPINRDPRKLKLADIDGDGKNDLIIGNQRDNTVYVYLNNGTNNTFSFNLTPTAITVPNLDDAGAIDVKDLNNDKRADIVVLSFEDSNLPIGILKNNSSPGTVKFTSSILNVSGTRVNTFIGDLNNDSYPEIAVTSVISSNVVVYENTTGTAGSNPTFSTTPISSSVTAPWGLNGGDMNGDGLLDLVVGTGSGVNVLINNFDGTTISFLAPTLLSTTGFSRNVKVGDLNGDARPDIAFTHNSTNGAPGSFGTYINRNCYVPEFIPDDLTFCLNDQFNISTTKTVSASYNWQVTSGNGTIDNNNGDNADITITSGTTATIEVTITPTNNGAGTCTNTSSQVFSLTNGAPTATPTITPSSPNDVCTGETNFTLTTAAGLDNYFWTLPDGSDGPNLNVLTIANLTAEDAGVYTLRTQTGAGCISDPTTYEVIVNEPPFISITNQDEDNFCDGSSITLEVPDYPGFTYSWEKDGAATPGTASTLSVNASGTYNAIISDGTCETKSPDYVVAAVPAPVSSFNTSYAAANTAEICIDVPLDFTATSTGSGAFALTYDWDFGDATNATGATTSHSYSVAQQYTATLTTSYTDISGCSDQANSTITVSDQVPGDIPITVVGGSTDKCPSDTLLVQLPANYVSYAWSTGDTDFEAEAFTARGENSVTLTADVETNIGCMVTVQQTIDNFPNSGIPVTADEGTIANDSITLPEGEQMITLNASNAVGDYAWTIDGTPSSVIAAVLEHQPTQRTTVITVTGTDANGCEETTTTTVLLPAILARKTFSPNADGQGFDCWEILNTSSLNGCTVYVFDNRGRHLLEADSPFPNNCVWDGTAEGQPVPEGIYYFVLQCDDELNNLTGTITLAR